MNSTNIHAKLPGVFGKMPCSFDQESKFHKRQEVDYSCSTVSYKIFYMHDIFRILFEK